MNCTVKQINNKINESLNSFYPLSEIQSFSYLIFEHILNFSKTDIYLKSESIINQDNYNEFIKVIDELKTYKPIQYILGKTEFYGLTFNVNHSVLIPRPETEELVDWIINDCKKDSILQAKKEIKILDIGTGSGCIAIALAKNIQNAQIEAIDISEPAIEVAKLNVEKNETKVIFHTLDILNFKNYSSENQYDIIVSNPPYIKESEKKLMHANVLDYEPHTALFVSDSDPLLFYKTIANFGSKYLTKNGKLYFEINEALGNETCEMLSYSGYNNITLKKDINGKDRMIYCKWLNC